MSRGEVTGPATSGTPGLPGLPGVLEPGILLVSGKGGTGKTTVAAAIASVAAEAGLRVVLTEMEGRGELARSLGLLEPGYAVRPTPFGFDVTSITPLEAALDYLHRYYGMDRLAAGFLRSGGLEQVVRGAPGFRDLLIAGKIYELARVRAGEQGLDPVHDLVIVDAPPTGQVAAFLAAPEAFAELIRVGPMKRRAANVAAMFRANARVLLVAIPEEMAVAETLEAVPTIARTGVRLSGVVVNRVGQDVFPTGTGRAGSAVTPDRLVEVTKTCGLSLGEPAAERILATARAGGRRRRQERRFVRDLQAAGRTIELPDISDVAPASRVRVLADALTMGGRRRLEPTPVSPGPGQGPTATGPAAPLASRPLDGPLAGVRIVVVCGSGGVGKTTVSAAIAVHGAASGRRTVLLTVDPARRLATALRLPRLAGERTTIPVGGGRSMDALQLDTKRTFDELVERFATEPAQVERVMTNPYYRRLADTLGGTHEYMAMEKLHQLAEEEDHDLIVIDTPPTRSALSFLDAPKRLTDFLGGRFLRMMLWPTAVAGRFALSAARFSARMVLRTVSRLVGAETLADAIEFLAAFEGMYAGFKERAARVMELLASPQCAFVIVASANPPSLAEAGAFLDRLDEAGMIAAATVVNRWRGAGDTLPRGTATAAERLARGGVEERAVAAILAYGLKEASRAALEGSELGEFVDEHPNVTLTAVPELEEDIHDVAGLRRFGRHLFDVNG